MSFFGAVFAALTMHWQWNVSGVALVLPFVVFAAIWVAAARVIRLPGSGIIPSKKVERAFMWSSIAEGGGLFLATNIVLNLHHPEMLLPAMALVVGLHFLPIAHAASFRPFYILAAALIAAAVAGFILGASIGGTVAGFMAALGLWVAATLAIHRDRLAKRGSALAA